MASVSLHHEILVLGSLLHPWRGSAPSVQPLPTQDGECCSDRSRWTQLRFCAKSSSWGARKERELVPK